MALLSIPIKRVPAQWFDFTNNNVRWDVRLYSVDEFLLCDVSVDGVPIVNGALCHYGIPVVKDSSIIGNLVFLGSETMPVTPQAFCESKISLFFAENPKEDIP